MQKRNSRKGSRHHHRHHRRKKLISRRTAATAAVLLCVCAILGIAVVREQKKQESMKITANNAHDVGNSYREVEYNGKKYRYNYLVTSVLFAGLDTEDELAETKRYSNKSRADSIYLVVMDKQNKKMSVLCLSRDTMTDVRRYSMNGNDQGMAVTHLGYAYSYGDGGSVSCGNLCEAVSKMLGDVPILNYVVASQKAVPYFNDLVGGVSLTVPNADLQDLYPDLSEGMRVTLNEDNVMTFLRYRDTEKLFSNEGRMERQKTYIESYIQKVKGISTGELEDIWTSLEEDMDSYVQTNITRNKYLDMVDLLQIAEMTEDSFLTLDGENRAGEVHDEFYPDPEALQEMILTLFYEEM